METPTRHWLEGSSEPLTPSQIFEQRHRITAATRCAPVGANEWKPIREVIPGIFDGAKPPSAKPDGPASPDSSGLFSRDSGWVTFFYIMAALNFLGGALLAIFIAPLANHHAAPRPRPPAFSSRSHRRRWSISAGCWPKKNEPRPARRLKRIPTKGEKRRPKMNPSCKFTVRVVLWALVACASHAAVASLLLGAVLALWFLIGGPYDSKPLQAGLVAAVFLPLLSDYPLAKRIMNSTPLKKITTDARA